MAERTIDDGEERFRGIIENALDIITLIDEEGTILYNSPSFSRQLNYELWEILGINIFDLIHGDDRLSVKRDIDKLIEKKYLRNSIEFRFKNKAGEWRVFESVVSNLLDNDSVEAIVINSRDITDHKKSLEELEKYKINLEDIVRQRTFDLIKALEKEKDTLEQQKVFISMISHEVRTPLTVIDGNAQIISSRGASLTQENLEKRAATIRVSVGKIVALIDRLFSETALEETELHTMLKPCDLLPIIRDVCVERLGIAPELKIKIDIEKDLPKLMLDEKLINQVMVNLISNAFKYSPENPIVTVAAYREGDIVLIRVSDSGVGIPSNELPKIFTRYFRASTSSGISGSGIGLNLVKHIVELHAGKVYIESELDVGTTITVELPIAPTS